MQHTAELLMPLPVLLILLCFAAPSVRSISNNAFSMQVQFGLAPALYYGFDYLTGNDIEMLSESALAAIKLMSFVCGAMYLFCVVRVWNEG